ncbi:DUF3221 domain-containing protein [Paenibacillus sp. FSL H8-0122]|uniref:DUF3221 domain-containing protein n=1 Tax=Paenibacillus sp. FSL H8-0122 TaxID=2954510 RepID=UPI0030FC9D78
MKLYLVAILLIMVLLSGCSENNYNEVKGGGNTVDIKGSYITKIENDRILAVSNKIQDFSSSGGQEVYYDAVWLQGVKNKDLKVGQKIEFTTKGITLTTYPGSVEIDQLKVINIIFDEAKMLPDEVIRKVIDRNPSINVFVVKDLQFDPIKKKWLISYLEGLKVNKDTEVMNTEIMDK